MSVALTARGLSKRYGRALGALGLHVARSRPGASPASSGRTAPGKTTLLALAVGLIEPTEGTIDVLGEEVVATPAQLGAAGSSRRRRRCTRSLSVADHVAPRRRAEPGLGRGARAGRGSRGSVSTRAARRHAAPAGSARSSR